MPLVVSVVSMVINPDALWSYVVVVKVEAPEPLKFKVASPSVIVVAFTEVKFIAKAFKLTEVEAELPNVIVLAAALVPILIFPVLLSVPNPIFPPDESIVKWLVDCISKVVPDVIDVLETESVIIVPELSNSIISELRSIFVDASFPIVIVLEEAPVPILIGWVIASLPIFIAPSDEFNSNIPSESIIKVSSELIVISPVPVDTKFIPPVPEFIFISLVSVTLPIVIVLEEEPVPILIGWATSSLPIFIIPADEFNSNIPSESIIKVSSELIVISPEPVDAKFIPPVPEFISIWVAPVTLPIVIVLEEAPVPILIGWMIASLPIFIGPDDEFNSNFCVESIKNVKFEFITIWPLLVKKFILPLPDFNSKPDIG